MSTKSKSPFLHRAIAVICILLGVIFIFAGLPYSSFYGDEAYQAMCVRYYSSAPLAMLSFYIGHIFTSIFTESLSTLRVLACVNYVCAYVVVCGWFYKITRCGFLTCVMFLLSALMYSVGGFEIYNWDTAVYPFSALTMTSFLAYIRRPKRWVALICVMLCGVLIALRITNMLVLPILIYVLWRRGERVQASVAPVLAIVIWLLIGALICGGVGNYISTFVLDNVISGHSPTDFHRFYYHFTAYFPATALNNLALVIPFLVALLLNRPMKSRWKTLVYASFIVSIYCLFKVHAEVYSSTGPMFALGFVALIIMLLYYPYHQMVSHKYKHEAVTIVLMVLLLGVGSDNAFERFNCSYAIVLATSTVWPLIKQADCPMFKRWLVLSVVSLLLLFGMRMRARIDEYDVAKLGDESINILYPTNIALIYNEMKSDIDTTIIDHRVAFLGRQERLFSYYYEDTPIFPIHVFSPCEEDMPQMVKLAKSADVIYCLKIPNEIESQHIISAFKHSDMFMIDSLSPAYYKIIKIK